MRALKFIINLVVATVVVSIAIVLGGVTAPLWFPAFMIEDPQKEFYDSWFFQRNFWPPY